MSECMVVASRVKKMARESEMNTSGEVLTALSEYIEGLVSLAIVSARKDGRKTIMHRDIEYALSPERGA